MRKFPYDIPEDILATLGFPIPKDGQLGLQTSLTDLCISPKQKWQRSLAAESLSLWRLFISYAKKIYERHRTLSTSYCMQQHLCRSSTKMRKIVDMLNRKTKPFRDSSK